MVYFKSRPHWRQNIAGRQNVAGPGAWPGDNLSPGHGDNLLPVWMSYKQRSIKLIDCC